MATMTVNQYRHIQGLSVRIVCIEGERVITGNLLAANTSDERSTDWWNRGRMRSSQLLGECLAYPEYSTDRNFKLRKYAGYFTVYGYRLVRSRMSAVHRG